MDTEQIVKVGLKVNYSLPLSKCYSRRYQTHFQNYVLSLTRAYYYRAFRDTIHRTTVSQQLQEKIK